MQINALARAGARVIGGNHVTRGRADPGQIIGHGGRVQRLDRLAQPNGKRTIAAPLPYAAGQKATKDHHQGRPCWYLHC